MNEQGYVKCWKVRLIVDGYNDVETAFVWAINEEEAKKESVLRVLVHGLHFATPHKVKVVKSGKVVAKYADGERWFVDIEDVELIHPHPIEIFIVDGECSIDTEAPPNVSSGWLRPPAEHVPTLLWLFNYDDTTGFGSHGEKDE